MIRLRPPSTRTLRIAGMVGGGLILLCLIALLVLAAFPWGMLRGQVEDRLSETLGRPVQIGSLERVNAFSLHPIIDIQRVTIPQADWAGAGQFATVQRARIQFAALPLLVGTLRLETAVIEGADVALVRDAQGRENWHAGEEKKEGGARPAIALLTIRNATISYDDAKQRRGFKVTLSSDDQRGVVIQGNGQIHGEKVAIHAVGAAVNAAAAGKPWSFRARIEGVAVGMTMAGTTDTPLDFGHFTADATAHGRDLALVDAIIEAGLPETQPVAIKAKVRRTDPDWKITGLAGTIGRSDLAGQADILKRDGRTRIEGTLSSNRFDFRDLSSNDGLRRAAAKRAQFGDRLLPDTAIDLATVAKTDGLLQLQVRELLWPGSSPFRSLKGTLKLDNSRLDLSPITLGLSRGRLEGKIRVDQQKGGPLLDIGLSLRDGRLIDFFPVAAIDGRLHGHFRLQGMGKTVRQAMGRANGTVALVAEDGVIPARTASLLGQDVGRGLTTNADDQARLRCMIARFDVKNGIARPSPVIIDTSRAQTLASGSINLTSERLSLALSGRPKQSSLLRLPGSVPVAGTIKAPDIQVPAAAKSVGGVLKMLGKAITGKQGDLAQDADCKGLSAQALR